MLTILCTIFLSILCTVSLCSYTDQQQENPLIPLFQTYPTLSQAVGYVKLGVLPTPIQKLEKLGSILKAPNLYIKKDNESGTLFGGNKVRKLEFLLGNAIAEKAQGVLTMGCAGSNHTCATALYAHQLGLSCTCLHVHQLPTAYARRNILLSYAHGADLNLFRTTGAREMAILAKNIEFKKKNDQCLYFIPSGGSNEIGTIGFVNAAFELKQQISQGLMPEPDLIYVALGSCGTAAGLMLGIKVAGLKSTIVPICTEPEVRSGQHLQKLTTLYGLTSLYLHMHDELFPFIELDPESMSINHNFSGNKYAQITQQAHDAIALLSQTEGIKLDGTYTGKAFAAMLDDIRQKNIQDKVILFWNSFCSGDFGDIIKNIDYKKLPKEYHVYFECQLQGDDQGV